MRWCEQGNKTRRTTNREAALHRGSRLMRPWGPGGCEGLLRMRLKIDPQPPVALFSGHSVNCEPDPMGTAGRGLPAPNGGPGPGGLVDECATAFNEEPTAEICSRIALHRTPPRPRPVYGSATRVSATATLERACLPEACLPALWHNHGRVLYPRCAHSCL